MSKNKKSDSQDFYQRIKDSQKLIQERSTQELPKEDEREALENLKRFFQILQEWDDVEKGDEAPDTPRK